MSVERCGSQLPIFSCQGTSFIPACFSFCLINKQLQRYYVKVGSLSQTSCQLAISSLPLHPIVKFIWQFCYWPPIIHLLVRDGSGVVTCKLSMGKGIGSENSLNFCITFWKTAQLDLNQPFCLLFKDNSVIFRWFRNFFIHLPAIRSISYQEMKHFAQHPIFPFLLYAIALSTFWLAQSTRVFSNDFR